MLMIDRMLEILDRECRSLVCGFQNFTCLKCLRITRDPLALPKELVSRGINVFPISFIRFLGPYFELLT